MLPKEYIIPLSKSQIRSILRTTRKFDKNPLAKLYITDTYVAPFFNTFYHPMKYSNILNVISKEKSFFFPNPSLSLSTMFLDNIRIINKAFVNDDINYYDNIDLLKIGAELYDSLKKHLDIYFQDLNSNNNNNNNVDEKNKIDIDFNVKVLNKVEDGCLLLQHPLYRDRYRDNQIYLLLNYNKHLGGYLVSINSPIRPDINDINNFIRGNPLLTDFHYKLTNNNYNLFYGGPERRLQIIHNNSSILGSKKINNTNNLYYGGNFDSIVDETLLKLKINNNNIFNDNKDKIKFFMGCYILTNDEINNFVKSGLFLPIQLENKNSNTNNNLNGAELLFNLIQNDLDQFNQNELEEIIKSAKKIEKQIIHNIHIKEQELKNFIDDVDIDDDNGDDELIPLESTENIEEYINEHDDEFDNVNNNIINRNNNNNDNLFQDKDLDKDIDPQLEDLMIRKKNLNHNLNYYNELIENIDIIKFNELTLDEKNYLLISTDFYKNDPYVFLKQKELYIDLQHTYNNHKENMKLQKDYINNVMKLDEKIITPRNYSRLLLDKIYNIEKNF